MSNTIREEIRTRVRQVYYLGKQTIDNIAQKYYGNYYFSEISKLLEKGRYEKKVKELNSKKKDKNDIYFIIRRKQNGLGLYTYVCIVISYIAYAIAKGYIPVVDMENYPNIYMDNSKIGKINAWELFYEQPMGISLEDIPNGAKVIKSSATYLPNDTPFLTNLDDYKLWNLWSKIYRDFIHFNNKTKKYTNNELKLISDKTVLGVLFRATDYSQLKPKNHPVQPSLDMALNKVKDYVNKHDIKYIYLATEAGDAEKRFRKEFPNMIIINKREYFDQQGVDFTKHILADVSFKRKNDNYLKGIEYLSSINILSKCNYFIGGACAGTYAAIIMNNEKYEDSFIWNLGLYK